MFILTERMSEWVSELATIYLTRCRSPNTHEGAKWFSPSQQLLKSLTTLAPFANVHTMKSKFIFPLFSCCIAPFSPSLLVFLTIGKSLCERCINQDNICMRGGCVMSQIIPLTRLSFLLVDLVNFKSIADAMYSFTFFFSLSLSPPLPLPCLRYKLADEFTRVGH